MITSEDLSRAKEATAATFATISQVTGITEKRVFNTIRGKYKHLHQERIDKIAAYLETIGYDFARRISPNLITPAQSAAARVFLGKSAAGIEKIADLPERAILFYEIGLRRPINRHIIKMRETYEAMGIEFIGNNGVKYVQFS